VTHGRSYAVQSHHIFPTSLLYSKAGHYRPDNHLNSKVVNEIANRAFLTGDSNIGLGNRQPVEYLREVEEKYPGALAKQFVPRDPALWELDRFEDFLAARRNLIADAINERMDELLAELELPKDQTLHEMLLAGESAILEFKSSLRWDVETRQINAEVEKAVAKTVAGLMNTEGGTLLIGVADNATVIGIEDDLKTLGKRPNRDGFQQKLTQVLSDYLGMEFNPYVRVSFEECGGRTACVVHVERSARPVYLADKSGRKEFYIRAGSTTRPLDIQAAHDYISMHWET
jgi:hypothetical protein